MVSIHTNLSSLIAQGSLTKSTNTLNRAIEQMSTGYKINHASDNAANYSIKTNMDTKIGAYQVAEENAMMGLDMLQTAESSLNQISDKLSRLRALAVTAQNGTYGEQSISALNSEAGALAQEINRIFSTATYNGKKLLDSSPEIPDGIGLTEDITPKYDGFIENPKDYTALEISNMTELKNVDLNTTISIGQYSISSSSELAKLAEMVDNGRITGGEFVLANDIDLSEYATDGGWIPIKVWNNNCIFNGNGNKITGLKINKPNEEEVGLFKINTGKIKNLAIEDCDIVGGKMTGAIAGSSRYTGALIENCYSTGSVSGTSLVGGVVGYIYDSKIDNCYSETKVFTTVDGIVGGLVGFLQGGTSANSFYKGYIYSAKGEAGGLLGYATANCIITNCFAESKIIINEQTCGGLVGYLAGTIDNCYAISDLNVMGAAGGLVGNTATKFKILDSYATSNIICLNNYNGGIIGTCSVSSDSSIENVRAYGNISATSYSGGLIGRLINKTSTLTIKNAVTYSKFEDPITASTKKSGSFIGINENTADEITYGTLIIENCGALQQGMDMISGSYKLVGGGFQKINYDLTESLAGLNEATEVLKSTILQIGISQKQSNYIEFNSAFEKGLFFDLNFLRLQNTSSIATIDNLLQQISEKQTELGATQNRLMSVLEEINVQYENLVSSRSTIQDADMSEVSATYIQQQILQQASATLMATANQTPAIALQLL